MTNIYYLRTENDKDILDNRFEPHERRVIEERSELEFKREKLNDFILGSDFQRLSKQEQDLLREQVVHMNNYSGVLWERIMLFTKAKENQ